MISLLEVLESLAAHLVASHIGNPRRQAEELLCDVLGCTRLQLFMNFEKPIESVEWHLCQERLQRRLTGEPLAYIQGSVEFYGCLIKVAPTTLIPRQETEILVDKIVQQLAKETLVDKTLLDLCCGSGCIGIALKKRLPALQVVLADISPAALAMARENAVANQVHVQLVQGDLLAPFQAHQFDYFVCNPPYISEAEYATLDKEVKDFEPKLALVSGKTGVEFYEQLATELPRILKRGGRGWFEIGYTQGGLIRELFSGGSWQDPCVEKDWAGHDRFFSVKRC